MDLFSCIQWFVLSFLIIWMSYRYLKAPENPWKKAGIPEVSRWDAFKAAIKLSIVPLHFGLQRNYKKYGKIFGSHFFGNLTLFVADPELIRHVLVKDFQQFVNRLGSETGDPIVDNMMLIAHGEKWKRIRNITSPTFSTGKIKKMTNIIIDCVEELEKNFEKDATSKIPSDVKKLVNAFTVDAMASAFFGTKIDSHNDPDNDFLKAIMKIFNMKAQMRFTIYTKINKLLQFLHLSPLNVDLFDYFRKLTTEIIEQRKRSVHIRNDFLQLMLDAAASNSSLASDAADENDATDDSSGFFKNDQSQEKTIPKEEKSLSHDEIVSQCIGFLLGGLDAVSSTISFTLYELALNEYVQEKLVSEIDQVLSLNQEKLTYENVQTMKYLDCVVSEVLRKYPPLIFILRQTTLDYTAISRNLSIPKGTSIVIPIHAMHHDPDYFPNPYVFDPNRFTDEEKFRRDSYVYLPFGTGPRNCIAMRFALIKVKLCLAHLLSQFQFCKCAQTQVSLKFQTWQPQMIAENIFLIVKRRKSCAFSESEDVL